MNKLVVCVLVVLAILMGAAFYLASILPGDAAVQQAAGPEPQIQPSQETEQPQTDMPTTPGSESLEDIQTPPKPAWMTIGEDRTITARNYFVFDVQDNAFLSCLGKAQDPVYPASITKLFTCYVALQYLPSDMVITVGDELDMVVPGSSLAGLMEGDQLTVSQLVEAMLLPSGNDAAYVLAVNTAKAIMDLSGQASVGAFSTQAYIDLFMGEMNQQAQEVGMTGTHFVNPDGIHQDDHYMSINDLAVLGKLAVGNALILEKTGICFDQVELLKRGDGSSEPIVWKNTNALIRPESEYYCPYAIGLKTGATPKAGSCLLSAFAYEGRQYIIGVFGCPDSAACVQDTLQLFNATIGIS